jgi:hypothetical protein
MTTSNNFIKSIVSQVKPSYWDNNLCLPEGARDIKGNSDDVSYRDKMIKTRFWFG